MTIENLDQSKRDALESGTATPYVQDEALRIIDQLTAALEAAERKAEGVADSYADALRRANDRAEALQERVAELEAELETAEKDRDERAQRVLDWRFLGAALQKRVAELEAEVAIAWDCDEETKRANAAESELEALRGRVAELEAALDARVGAHRACKARVAELEADRVTELDVRVRFTERAEKAEAELEALRGRVALADAVLTEGARVHGSDLRRAALEALRGR